MRLDELAEADKLLREIDSWTEDEIEEFPRFYEARARRYRQLLKQGDPEQL